MKNILLIVPLFGFFLISFTSYHNQDIPAAITQKTKAQPGLAMQLDSFLCTANRFSQFNGSVIVCYKGKIILDKGYGFKDAAKGTLNDKHTIFQIGSVTKEFTSTLILKLAEQGRLSLQDKLSDYFPNFQPGRQITIRHLLTHTSGLYDYSRNLSSSDSAILSHPVAKEKIIKQFMTEPLAFSPGSSFSYSNSGYFLLGMIAEKVTGKSWEENIRQYILAPLEMTHSGFDFHGLNDTDKAIGYKVYNEEIQQPDINWDSTVSYAAGSLYATTGDMLKWARAVTQKKILTEKSWKEALTINLHHYGYGWEIDSLYGVKYVGHSGGLPGFSAYMLIFPEQDLQIITLTNVHEGSYVTPISTTLAAMVLGKPYTIATAHPDIDLPLDQLKTYEGSYRLNKKHVANIKLNQGKLFIEAVSNKLGLTRLVHADNDIFFLSNVFLDIQLKFKKDKAGKVTSLVIVQNGGNYEWKKVD